MNKKIILLLTLTYILLMPATFAFTDTKGHWAEKVVDTSSNMGIIKGYSQDLFLPDNNMKRAELMAVINRLFAIESESDRYIPDVSRQDWYHSDVRKSVAMGIVKGDTDGSIRPNDFVTREQAITIIARAFNIKPADASFETNFVDNNEISSWAKGYFITFTRNGYLIGYADQTIKPKNNITRAEVLTLIDRLIGRYIQYNMTNAKLNGAALISQKDIKLSDSEIYGDLIIGETACATTTLNNVTIEGDLILYAPLDFNKNVVGVKGSVVKLYESKITSNLYYKNNDYGISFPLPDGATVRDFKDGMKIDYSAKDQIVVDIKKSDNYYYEDIEELAKATLEEQKYDSIYNKIDTGKLGIHSFVLYKDNSSSYLMVIKRDNILYKLLFINIISDNIFDNTISNIEFFGGALVNDHNETIYKNKDLCLKFTYRNGYIGVDDSYNTGIVYNGESIFKLFVQVTKITDIDDYTVSQVKELLKTLNESDGKIIDEQIKTLNAHNAIMFEIDAEDNKIISLYVIVGNNLYNFIFKGENAKMDAIGKAMFAELTNSIEF